MAPKSIQFKKKSTKAQKILTLVSYIVACDAVRNLNPVAIGFRSAITSYSKGFSGTSHRQELKNRSPFSLDFEDSECSDYYFHTPTREQNEPLTDSNDAVPIVRNASLQQSQQSKGKGNGPSRGGGAMAPSLTFYENMFCGAVSRSIAQVCTHPANT